MNLRRWFYPSALEVITEAPLCGDRNPADNDIGFWKQRVHDLESQARVRCGHCGQRGCLGIACEELSRVTAKLENARAYNCELEAYIENAAIEADKRGRVSGEPLADWIASLPADPWGPANSRQERVQILHLRNPDLHGQRGSVTSNFESGFATVRLDGDAGRVIYIHRDRLVTLGQVSP